MFSYVYIILGPGHFTTGEKATGAHLMRGLVGLKARLDAVKKRKILPCRKSNRVHPARRYTG
jgi:hypothetical protein